MTDEELDVRNVGIAAQKGAPLSASYNGRNLVVFIEGKLPYGYLPLDKGDEEEDSWVLAGALMKDLAEKGLEVEHVVTHSGPWRGNSFKHRFRVFVPGEPRSLIADTHEHGQIMGRDRKGKNPFLGMLDAWNRTAQFLRWEKVRGDDETQD